MKLLLQLEKNQLKRKLKMMSLYHSMMMHLLMRHLKNILLISIQISERKLIFKNFSTISKRLLDNKKLLLVSKKLLILLLSQLISRLSLMLSNILNLFLPPKETMFFPGSPMKYALTFSTISSSLIFFKVCLRRIKLSYSANFLLYKKSAEIILKILNFLKMVP